MNFESTITLTSKTPGFEGVVFTFNKMTEGRRIKLRLSMAEVTARLRGITTEATRMADEATPDTARLSDLLDQTTVIIEDDINPRWVRWGLKAIDGLDIDGKPATVEALIEAGPRDLYTEVYNAIKEAAGLTEDERGESAPPTTSSALVDGRMSDTSAGLAVN